MFKFIAGFFYTQWETSLHRFRVQLNIVNLIDAIDPPNKWKLYFRGWKHDWSKYRWSEASYFAKTIFDLKHSVYGSEEYKEMLASIQPAIKVHYERNSHHPEHHKNGVQDMTELDKLEMICDWSAAVRRHKDGDIFKSIEINQTRFGYDDKTKEWLISMAKLIS
jgi:hypothetical protein